MTEFNPKQFAQLQESLLQILGFLPASASFLGPFSSTLGHFKEHRAPVDGDSGMPRLRVSKPKHKHICV